MSPIFSDDPEAKVYGDDEEFRAAMSLLRIVGRLDLRCYFADDLLTIAVSLLKAKLDPAA